METRDEYVEKFTVQLKEWNAKIDKLAIRAKKTADGTKIELSKQMELLRQKRVEFNEKFQHKKEADSEAFKSLVEGTHKAWEDLKQTYQAANKKLKQE